MRCVCFRQYINCSNAQFNHKLRSDCARWVATQSRARRRPQVIAPNEIKRHLVMNAHRLPDYESMKKEIEEYMNGLKLSMIKDRRTNRAVMEGRLHDLVYYQKIMARQGDIGEKMKYFLATGNLVSTSGLDLMQASIPGMRASLVSIIVHAASATTHRASSCTSASTR